MESHCIDHSAHKARLDAGERRMDKHSGEIDKLQECIVQLTQIVESDRERNARVEERLECLEGKPAQRWEAITSHALTAAIGAVIAYLFVQLGLG